MSGYGNLRKRQTEAPQESRDETRCAADHCPCRGTVSQEGGRFLCTAHSAVPSDRWPRLTEMLHSNRWLIGFIDEMQRMDHAHGDWRGFASEFWKDSDPFCIPDPREYALPYQNRMRGELLFRCGLTKKRPEPRIPQVPTSRGNAGRLVGARA